jgi:hydroxymethylpyrimidine/phosphomethylpyrimidine kinase
LGWDVKTFEDMKSACRELKEFGSQYVLLKGGHRVQIVDEKPGNIEVTGENTENEEDMKFKGKAVDILYGDEYKLYSANYFDKSVHGTGCMFASAIAGYMAGALALEEAIEMAKKLVTSAIMQSSPIGEGIDSINITLKDQLDDEQLQIITKVTKSVDKLLQILQTSFIPEVGINLGFARENAKELSEICALTGRIVRVGECVGTLGRAGFGASKHVGRIILAAMKYDVKSRSAVNIKFRQEIIETCKHLGFSVGTFSRENEPEDVSSMEWGTQAAIEQLGYVPDIIYDTGGIGKEPMIRILGKDPEDVVSKLETIINSFIKH